MIKTATAPQTKVYYHKIWPALCILFVILAAACSKQRGAPIPERWGVCTDEDRLNITHALAHPVSIPDSPGCMVQLLVMPDRAEYRPGDYITFVTMIKVQGDCAVPIVSTHPMRDFYPIVIANETDKNVLLTEEGQKLKKWAESGEGDKNSPSVLTKEKGYCVRLPIDEWFELSAPGTYTSTLVRRINVPPYEVSGNTITFTRAP